MTAAATMDTVELHALVDEVLVFLASKGSIISSFDVYRMLGFERMNAHTANQIRQYVSGRLTVFRKTRMGAVLWHAGNLRPKTPDP